MIPPPVIVVEAIAFPLQLFAARTSTFCLQAAGVPVLREGNVIVLARTTLEVAEACSGIRSLQAPVAPGAVYGHLTQRAVWKRWGLVLLSIPIAIVANVFRVSGTGLLAHFRGARAAEGFYAYLFCRDRLFLAPRSQVMTPVCRNTVRVGYPQDRATPVETTDDEYKPSRASDLSVLRHEIGHVTDRSFGMRGDPSEARILGRTYPAW